MNKDGLQDITEPAAEKRKQSALMAILEALESVPYEECDSLLNAAAAYHGIRDKREDGARYEGAF